MADWANIQYNGQSVGTLYTDGTTFGFVPVVTSPDAVAGFGIVTDLIKAALIAEEITAEDSYQGILGSLDNRDGFSYESVSGDSIVKPQRDVSGLKQFAVDDEPSTYFLKSNEDEEVLALVANVGDDLLVRQNGDWVKATDENYPDDDDDDYFIDYVPESAIETYDKIINEKKVPVVDDFEVVQFDD